MSGGSYDYLYCKEAHELFNPYQTSQIDEMADCLLKLGYGDVARDMRRLSEYIKSAYNRVDVLAEQLKEVMHAVEWYESADIGEDSLGKYIENYRCKSPANDGQIKTDQWCKFKSEKNCDFCAFHSDCKIHYGVGDDT